MYFNEFKFIITFKLIRGIFIVNNPEPINKNMSQRPFPLQNYIISEIFLLHQVAHYLLNCDTD